MAKKKAKFSTRKKPRKRSYFDSDLEDAKAIRDCEDAATVDCYNEGEQANGWLNCLQDILGDIQQVKVLGEIVNLEGLDLQGEFTVVANVELDGEQAKVTVDSIQLIKPTRAQKLWQRAYINWEAGSGF